MARQPDLPKQEPHSQTKVYLLPREILGADECNDTFHPVLLIKLGTRIPVSDRSNIWHPHRFFELTIKKRDGPKLGALPCISGDTD